MRTKRLEIRLSGEELTRARELASIRNMRVGTFIREASLHKIPPTIPPINIDALAQLRGIANNLNQLARLANASEKGTIIGLTDTLEALRISLMECRT